MNQENLPTEYWKIRENEHLKILLTLGKRWLIRRIRIYLDGENDPAKIKVLNEKVEKWSENVHDFHTQENA